MADARALRLAARHGRRALRGGEGWILLLALAIAVAAVSAVTRMNDRVYTAMGREGAQTLAANLRLNLQAPLDAKRAQKLAATGVTTAALTEFPSVARHGDAIALVSVKAVVPAYPLRGALTLRHGPPGSATVTVTHGPPRGSVWVGQRVLDKLSLKVGDHLDLGDAHPVIGAVLVVEPDRGPDFSVLAPRVLMARADLAQTGLLGPGSRVHYAVLIAGSADQLAAARAAIVPTLGHGERLETPNQANRGLATAMRRADVFLNLAALVAVILAGVAIAMAARQYADARLDEIALLKTLGGARGLITRILLWQLGLAGALGIGAGMLCGYTAQAGLSLLIARLLGIDLPQADWTALWPGPAAGAVLLGGFAWPALAGARNAPPARVLARALSAQRRRIWPVHALATVSVAVMAAAATRDLSLTLRVVGSALAGTLAFALGALALLWLVERLRRISGLHFGPGLRLGLAALVRRRAATVLQIVAFGIGLTMLFMLVIVRGDLLAGWQNRVAATAPNRFLVNITPQQRHAVADFLAAQKHIGRPTLYPIVRARLTRVNGRSVDRNKALQHQAGELARRALNLSWAAKLKADNRLTAGHWWQAGDDGKPRISIDTSVARRLHVGINDRLSFDIAGRDFTATVESIRDIDWSSLQANFYVLFPPGFLNRYPATYITSLYLPDGDHAVLANLVRRFTNVSVIDIAAILDQLKRLIDRVSLAVELVFGFTLAAGLVVLLAAVQASRGERRREAALLRALGARSRWLRQAAVVECLLIGFIAAVLAAVVAQAAAVLMATQLLHLAYTLRWVVWISAIALATLTIAAAGVLSLGNIFRQPAWTSLRENE